MGRRVNDRSRNKEIKRREECELRRSVGETEEESAHKCTLMHREFSSPPSHSLIVCVHLVFFYHFSPLGLLIYSLLLPLYLTSFIVLAFFLPAKRTQIETSEQISPHLFTLDDADVTENKLTLVYSQT